VCGPQEVPLAEHWRTELEEYLFEDMDHEFLYEYGPEQLANISAHLPGVAPMDLSDWFVPFNPSRHLPPYAEDQDSRRQQPAPTRQTNFVYAYDPEDLARWLGLTLHAMRQRVASGELLGTEDVNGALMFPAWQFTPDGTVLPVVREALTAWPDGPDRHAQLIAWFTEPAADLDGYSPEDWLGFDMDSAAVVQAARSRQATQDS